MLDHYSVLGVAPNASKEEIRKAYKALVKKYHPDVSGYDSSKIFAEIVEAYGVLSDSNKRSVYDAFFLAGSFSKLSIFCGSCQGLGLIEKPCHLCGGDGSSMKDVKYGKYKVKSKIICTLCNGTGIIKTVCFSCT